jgi:hypothetical protein
MKHKAVYKKKNIDNKTLKTCISSVYSGPIKEEGKGIKIRCPWHSPDNNPSCLVFYGSGLFYCVVCHGDKPKGKRGVGPYKAFQELGMSESKARSIFIDGDNRLSLDLEPSHLPDLNLLDSPKSTRRKILPKSKVVSREPWPKWWGFRDIDCKTLQQQWCIDRVNPEKVYMERERLPRISLSIGGHEKGKDTKHPDYLKSEVCLRLSSSAKAKTINSPGLTLDPEVTRPQVATMFGLINNKLASNCRGLILVEGPYDCIHLLQHIHDPRIGGGFEVVALLGTPQWDNIRRQIQTYIQRDMLNRKIPIILAFDHDAAGKKLTKTAIETLLEDYLPASLLKVLNYPQKVKDPGDLSFDDFYESLVALGFDFDF